MWSENLKMLRERHGYTQQELSDKLGISRCTLANWELGRREPNTKTILKISKFFNISLDDLFDVPRIDKTIPNILSVIETYFKNRNINQHLKDEIIKEILEVYFKHKGE